MYAGKYLGYRWFVETCGWKDGRAWLSISRAVGSGGEGLCFYGASLDECEKMAKARIEAVEKPRTATPRPEAGGGSPSDAHSEVTRLRAEVEQLRADRGHELAVLIERTKRLGEALREVERLRAGLRALLEDGAGHG